MCTSFVMDHVILSQLCLHFLAGSKPDGYVAGFPRSCSAPKKLTKARHMDTENFVHVPTIATLCSQLEVARLFTTRWKMQHTGP